MSDNDFTRADKFIEPPMSSHAYEKRLQAEVNNKQSNTEFRYPLSARTIVLPITSFLYRGKASERRIIMTDGSNDDKEALYKLIVAVYNYVFYDKSAAKSAISVFIRSVPRFVSWLNTAELSNRYLILKEYEAYHFDKLNNHGGSSVLLVLRVIFTYGLDKTTELHEHLTTSELRYLLDLSQTKVSPNLNKAQKSLASYFGQIDWLRSEDVGVGNELYTVLASPKLTINSLILTASTIVIELNKYKRELHSFLNSNKIDESYFILPNKLSHTKKREFVGNTIYQLISVYHDIQEPKEILKSALEVVLMSNVTNVKSFQALQPVLVSKLQCETIFKNKLREKTKVSIEFCAKTFSQVTSGNLFSFKMLQELTQCEFSSSATVLEELMFSWLMASLTVQPYDIPKLTKDSFRLLKVGGKVRHIECEYFKGRAKVFHTTRSLSSGSLEGQALLAHLSNFKQGKAVCSKKTLVISTGINSLVGVLSCLLSTNAMLTNITTEHLKQDNLPLVIPRVLVSLIQHGVYSIDVVSRKDNLSSEVILKPKQQTACSLTLFGLQAIKNSAVHAHSDPYTLHYLINRNSHTNQTEKENYLNSDNEEWMNSAGRITREVMLDIIKNVYDLGFESLVNDEKKETIEKFNSEFMAVTEDISYKTGEMLARLKIITEQKKGKVNEVGILALSDIKDIESFSPLYVIDSPVTAWKMNNYIHEFNTNYRKLLSRSPEYLYKTAIPTVEWVEYTLSQLSKGSQIAGFDLFKNAQKNGVKVSVFHSI